MKMSFSSANIDKADTGDLLNTHPENCKTKHWKKSYWHSNQISSFISVQRLWQPPSQQFHHTFQSMTRIVEKAVCSFSMEEVAQKLDVNIGN